MTVYPQTSHPKKEIGEPFSVDVIILTKSKMLNIGYYNFDTKDWAFHTDTMEDVKEFIWCYPPKKLNSVHKSVFKK
jgi:hypothetical protein